MRFFRETRPVVIVCATVCLLVLVVLGYTNILRGQETSKKRNCSAVAEAAALRKMKDLAEIYPQRYGDSYERGYYLIDDYNSYLEKCLFEVGL